MYRTNTCGELNISHVGNQVVLSGWVQRTRDLGGLTFVDLRDRYGITQLFFNMETNSVLCNQARELGREYVIQAEGIVAERSAKNPKIPTGEIEIDVTGLDILSRSKTPPFEIDDETKANEFLRLEYRYLDLAAPSFNAI